MEKNTIKQKLDLIEKLLGAVNSREEYLYLLGQKEALLPLRFLFDFIQVKGGNRKIESDFFENQKRCGLQDLHQRKLALHKQESSHRSFKERAKRMCIPTNPEFRRSSERVQRHGLEELTAEQEDFIIESGLENLRFRRHFDAFPFFKSSLKFSVLK